MYDILGTAEIKTSTDIAYKWIQVLFAKDPAHPFGNALSTFSTALTFLGSLFMGWHIIVGIVASAYHGKVLGQRWHQIWAPMRVILGFGMLVPVAGGFSTVHYLLKDVIGVAAVNLGNAPIIAYIDGAASRETQSSIYTNVGKDVMREFFQREVCYAVVTAINQKAAGRYSRSKPRVYHPDVNGNSRSWPVVTELRLTRYQEWDYGDCGSVVLNEPPVQDSEIILKENQDLTEFQKARVTAIATMLTSLRSEKFINYTMLGEFVATHAAFSDKAEVSNDLIELLKENGTVSKTLVQDTVDISNAYNKAVGGAAATVFKQSAVDNAGKLKERIETYGFMAAGSYERSLSAISGLAVGLANDLPSTTTMSLTAAYKGPVDKAIAVAAASRVEDGQYASASGIAEPEDDAGWMTYLMGQVFGPNISNMKMKKDSPDPIGDMITFGHNMLAVAASGIIALSLANGLSGAAKNIPFAGGAIGGLIDYLSQWIGYLIMICIIVGFIHSMVLPMLPMMMVFVMGVSWLILYLEAAIAGVLWSFAFIRMDGDEFFDKNQAPGVTLLFNLICRPAIGMLAYCGMLLLLPELLRSLTMIWDQAYALQTGGMGWLTIVQWLGGIVLFTWMQWHLTMRLTGLIPTIADRVGHWMGFSGMHGYNDGQEASAATGALVAASMAASKAPVTPGGLKGSRGGDPMAAMNAKIDAIAEKVGATGGGGGGGNAKQATKALESTTGENNANPRMSPPRPDTRPPDEN